MKCHVCGGTFHPTVSDIPFKLGPRRIVIIKSLSVLQCGNCGEYLIEHSVMQSVDRLLAQADASAEVEIVQFAA